MQSWLQPDWQRMFVPQMALPEIFLRGTLMYLALCVFLRLILKRQCGKVSLNDLLVIMLIASVAKNPLVGESTTIPDGLLVILTILFWSHTLDWLGYHSPRFRALLQPPPLLLIRKGHILTENLHGELMTEDQLRSKLRQHGVADPAQVAEAYMEGDGHISVIKDGK